jgi:hypothetical protein
VLAAWALLSYGSVQKLGQRTGANGQTLPPGEGHPPAEFWIRRWISSPPNERPAVAHEAEAELHAWKRRPPELNEIKTETLDDLKRRILRDGEGWSAKDVALACRCTPTLVSARASSRRTRTPRPAAPTARSRTPASCTARASACVRSLTSPASRRARSGMR